MSDFQFGMGSGHLPKKADTIARKHGARLVNYTEPNGYKRHWFTCDNLGSPHDYERAQAVLGALGLLEPKPTKGELKAATIIATGYRRLLNALGHPDELNDLSKEIDAVAKIIATNRDRSWVDPWIGEEDALERGDKP